LKVSGEIIDFAQRTSTIIKATTAIVNAGLALIPLAAFGNPVISWINLANTIRETILVDNNNGTPYP
jgi:hypothetical protein